MRFFRLFILSFALCCLLSSCKAPDYYRAKAVDRAREYAIPRLRDLDETQLDFIRYSPPAVMDAEIFVRNQTEDKSPAKNDIIQTCIVWNVPGLDYSIVVFGVSERRMFDWYPDKLIRKKFTTSNVEKYTARDTAVLYAMNNMLYLSDEVRNHIRFTPSEPSYTNFELDPDLYKKKTKMTRKQMDRDKEIKDTLIQSSFVWDTYTPGEKVVVSGFSFEKFAGWYAVRGMVMSEAELNAHIVAPPPPRQPKEKNKKASALSAKKAVKKDNNTLKSEDKADAARSGSVKSEETTSEDNTDSASSVESASPETSASGKSVQSEDKKTDSTQDTGSPAMNSVEQSASPVLVPDSKTVQPESIDNNTVVPADTADTKSKSSGNVPEQNNGKVKGIDSRFQR